MICPECGGELLYTGLLRVECNTSRCTNAAREAEDILETIQEELAAAPWCLPWP